MIRTLSGGTITLRGSAATGNSANLGGGSLSADTAVFLLGFSAAGAMERSLAG